MNQKSKTLLIVLLLLPVLFSCAGVVKTAKEPKNSGPDIQFVEPVYDFGVAGREQKISHGFAFRNSGNEVLKITRVAASCGSDIRVLEKDIFKPGEEGIVEVEFKTKKYTGKQQSEYAVYTNDPDKSETRLIVIGEIKRLIYLKPKSLNFGKIKKGETITRSIKVLQLEQEQLVIKRVQADRRYFEITKKQIEDENERGVEIIFTVKPDIPSGIYSDLITIHTNVKKRPRVDVPIYIHPVK